MESSSTATKISLAQLDGERVTVEVIIAERHVCLTGVVTYAKGLLEVLIEDAAGDFKVFVDERTWTGSASLGESGYLLKLE